MREPPGTSFGWGHESYEGVCEDCGAKISLKAPPLGERHYSTFKFEFIFGVARKALEEECDCSKEYSVN